MVTVQAAVSVLPGSISRSLDSGGPETVVLTLENTGSTRVAWSARALQTSLDGDASASAAGQDEFGYRWKDNSEEGGPTFSWVDLSSYGTPLNLADDDAQVVALPFPFVFYGIEYNTVRVSSNGYLTFGPDGTDHTNDPVPSSADPNALIAAYWTDLDPSLGGSIVTYHDEVADRFIVQYTDVQPFGGGEPVSFQTILHLNGDILLQYELDTGIGSMEENLTVGIENAEGTIGSSVAYNSATITSGLAVRFSSPTWLSVTPVVGELAIGESTQLEVTLNAGALNEGLYEGTIELTETGSTPVEVPVDLTVSGEPAYSLQPASLVFEAMGVGGTRMRTLNVVNSGTAPFTLTDILFIEPDFSTTLPLPVIIEPGASQQVEILFTPSTTGMINGSATFLTDPVMDPVRIAGFHAEGLDPADIAINPDAIQVTLPAGDSADIPITISNNGIAPLNWESVLDGDIPSGRQQVSSASLIEADFSREFAHDRIIVRTSSSGDSTFRSAAEQAEAVSGVATAAGATERNPLPGLPSLEVWRLGTAQSGEAARATAVYTDQPKERLKALVKWLNAQPEILYAEPDYLIQLDPTESTASVSPANSEGPGNYPNDPSFGLLWGMDNQGQQGGLPDADIDAPEAWLLQTDAEDVVIAVIDTGVEYTHADLAANMWVNEDEIPNNGLDDDGNGYVDDVHGWDWVNGDRDPIDDHNHGTHCAGTIAAVGNNAIGVVGVTWNAQIMALKFLDYRGSGYLSDALYAFDYAAANGARITSNSWGGGGYSQAMVDSMAAAADAGVLHIAAAGNDSRDTDLSPAYPASYELPELISVAATTRFDTRAYFSNYGATSVDLGAPGDEILSSVIGNAYAHFSGTSMATPHVSGAAAMLLAKNPLLSPVQLKQILMESVDPVEDLTGRTVTGGRLNLRKALDSVAPPWFFLEPGEGVLDPGDSLSGSVHIDASFLPVGELNGTISVFSNDPDEPILDIPLTVTVTSAPALATEPAMLDFGDVFRDSASSRELVLVNSGTEVLTVHSLNALGPFSAPAALPITIPAGAGFPIEVVASSSSPGRFSGVLLVGTNDPTDPVHSVSISANFVEPPAISAIPDRLDFSLVSGAEVIHPLQISNSGANNLDFSFSQPRPPWLAIGPESGTLPAGGSAEIELFIHSTGLPEGQYAHEISLDSNDPQRSRQPLLIVLNVSDGPVALTNPSEVDFGIVYLGYPQEQVVTLSNEGNEDLVLSAASVTGSGLSLVDPWSGTLSPGTSRAFTVRANPVSAGGLSGNLVFTSNDPVHPSLEVPLTGQALEVPSIFVTPGSFSFSLDEGQTDAATLTIENTGLEVLEASLAVNPEEGGFAFGKVIQTIDLDEATGDETHFAAEYLDNRFFVGGANRGPNIPMVYVLDKEGNYLREFPLPGVPAGYYGVYDMANDGQFLYGGWAGGIIKFDTAGNLVDSIPLPEEFSVIAGIAYDPASGHLWINGFTGDILEIDTDGTILRRVTPSGMENTYGMAWDDASPGGPFLWIMEKKELATRKVHQFDPLAGQFTGLTFTVNPAIGWSAGLAFTTEWQEGQATLLPVTQAVDNRWVHVVNIADVQNWLSLDTYAVSVPPGTSRSLAVQVDAGGVLGGVHNATLELSSNDPENPARSIPVTLSVTGTPALELPDPQIVFQDSAFVGEERAQSFRIRNSGTDTLSIDSLIVTGPAFSLTDNAPSALAPQETRELVVSFLPDSTGSFTGSLQIQSNDPLRPVVDVPILAEGVPQPVIRIDTNPVVLNLFAGETSSFALQLSNTGGGTLVWQASPHDNATLSPQVLTSSFRDPVVPGLEPPFRDTSGKGDLHAFVDRIISTPKSIPWADGFEDGRFVDSWYMTYNTSKTEVSGSSAGEGTFSFHAYAATESGHRDCIYQVFDEFQPDYFSFRVRSDSLDQANAYVTLGNSTPPQRNAVFFFNTQTALWFMGDNYDSVSTASEEGRWYHIECRNMDWASRTFDYYIDGTLIKRGVGFRSPDVASINRLDLYNFRSETSAWWDDLRLSVETAEWMNLQTAASELESGVSLESEVTVSAGYLAPGTYTGYLIVRSNDPATPESSLPVTLNVSSAPGIHLPETTVAFGGIVTGGTASHDLIVSNSGSEPLSLNGLAFSDSAFSSPGFTPLTLQPGESTVLEIGFSPSAVSEYSATLDLLTNSPVPPPAISLSGEGLSPPQVVVETTPIVFSVPAGQDTTGTLQVANSGAGILELEAFLFTEAVSGDGASTTLGTLRAGGPDNYGYRFRDERDSDGPLFQWEEIAIPEGGTGDEMTVLTGFTASSDATVNDDAYVWPFNLPFSFPFYGADYSQIAVGAYGVVYFEDDGFGWYMTELPTDNVASGRGTNTFIATYNDNLDINPGAIYTKSLPDKVIVQHYRVTSLFNEWATFQTILYPNGDIRMQWQETGPWLKGSSATIGIQGDAMNALPYGRWDPTMAEPGRCIYYTHPGNPYRDWLRSENRSARLASGESHSVNLTFKGTYLLPGTYNATIEVRSNDATNPLITIPVTLNVTDPSSTGLALVRNEAAVVVEGDEGPLDESNLLAASPLAPSPGVVFTVTDHGSGECRLDGSLTSSFTQQALMEGRVTYLHDGSDSSETTVLGFTVSDGTESIGPFGLEIRVSAVNDPPALTGPDSFAAVDGIYVNLAGMTLEDPDISQEYADWYLSFSVNHGKVYMKPLPGGIYTWGTGSVQNNDTAFVHVETWLSRLQTNFNTAGGIQYMPDPGFTGEDLLTVTVKDNGNSGNGPAYQTVMTIPIQVYGSDYIRWRHGHFTEAQLGDPAMEASIWGDQANPDRDPYSNIFEYLLMGNPWVAEAIPLVASGYDGVHIWLQFPVRRSHPGVTWHGEWSEGPFDASWHASGIVTELVEELEAHDLVRLRIPLVDPGGKFLRLQVNPE